MKKVQWLSLDKLEGEHWNLLVFLLVLVKN